MQYSTTNIVVKKMCEGWEDCIIQLGMILDELHQTVEGTQGEARMVSWTGYSH
jgi:hypothetical protein